MKQEIRIGVVGCGYIASEVHLPVWLAIKGAKVVACADTDSAKVKSLTQAFRIKSEYSSLQEMLRHEELDLVDVCTPPQTHTSVLTSALEEGVNCISEKPLTLKVSEAESIVAKARERGLRLYVIHNYSFLPAVRSVKRLVSAGRIGEVRIVDTRYMAPLQRRDTTLLTIGSTIYLEGY